MGEGKQGELAVHTPKDLAHNPITQLQTKYKDLENGFKSWLAKQSLPVEAAVVTLTSAAQGAAMGGFMGTLTNDVSSAFPPTPPPGASINSQTMASFQQAQVTVFLQVFFTIIISEGFGFWEFDELFQDVIFLSRDYR